MTAHFKRYFLLTTLLLSSCGWQSVFDERQAVPLSPNDFNNAEGHELAYRLFLPNSYSGWTPGPDNELRFDPQSLTYQIYNVDINQPPVDSWGARFKISSADWAHEFAFTKAHDTPEQSKFGIKQRGTVVQLQHIFYASDLYFELPRDANANFLHAEFKVIKPGEQPQALLHIYYTSNKLQPGQVAATTH